ncbi:MAG TPA: DUF1223 domain-containing protein [Casimicrobiaceae bacterium]
MMIIQMMLKMPMLSPRLIHAKYALDRSTACARFRFESGARRRTLTALLLLAAANAGAAAPEACRVASGVNTTPLIELYTSEGCDSCPPADRWLASHFVRGVNANAPVALAFHVDYWDRLGWTDRFASRAYTERQYAAMHANGKTFVVTPQILLQGHELSASGRTMPQPALDKVAREPAAASIELTAASDGKEFAATAVSRVGDAAVRAKSTVSIAYVDSGLVSEVKAGENKGARLTHDHVVRALKSASLAAEPFSTRFTVPSEPGVSPTLVAFVQNAATGDILQAVALPLSNCGR